MQQSMSLKHEPSLPDLILPTCFQGLDPTSDEIELKPRRGLQDAGCAVYNVRRQPFRRVRVAGLQQP